jgi:hypothetical protein
MLKGTNRRIARRGSTWLPMGCAEPSLMRLPENKDQTARDRLARRLWSAGGPRRNLAVASPDAPRSTSDWRSEVLWRGYGEGPARLRWDCRPRQSSFGLPKRARRSVTQCAAKPPGEGAGWQHPWRACSPFPTAWAGPRMHRRGRRIERAAYAWLIKNGAFSGGGRLGPTESPLFRVFRVFRGSKRALQVERQGKPPNATSKPPQSVLIAKG